MRIKYTTVKCVTEYTQERKIRLRTDLFDRGNNDRNLGPWELNLGRWLNLTAYSTSVRNNITSNSTGEQTKLKCAVWTQQRKRKNETTLTGTANKMQKMATETHEKEKYACQLCSHSSSNKSNFNRHMVIHTDSRPFRCGICGYAFRQKINLKRHTVNNKCLSGIRDAVHQ